MKKNLLSIKEASHIIGKSQTSIRRYIDQGLLEKHQDGKRVYTTQKSVRKFINNNETGSLSRRQIIITAGTITATGVALSTINSGLSGWVFVAWDKLKEAFNSSDKNKVDINSLFPFWDKIKLYPGQGHPNFGFHPDIVEAQEKVSMIMEPKGSPVFEKLETCPVVGRNGDILLIGGPIPNKLSLAIHCHTYDGNKISPNPNKNIGTRWYFHYPYSTNKDLPFKRFVNNELITTSPKAIVDRYGKGVSTYPKYSKVDPSTGHITTDYLLISVIPNIFREGATGDTIIDVADLNGQGDKYFYEILSHADLFRELLTAVKGKKYFQVLYEVNVINDQDKKLTSPKDAKLIDIHFL